jgi:hypothetical protein
MYASGALGFLRVPLMVKTACAASSPRAHWLSAIGYWLLAIGHSISPAAVQIDLPLVFLLLITDY